MNISKIALLAAAPLAILASSQPASIAAATETSTHHVHEHASARWVGTATAVIQYGDLTIVTDPAFDGAGGHYDIGFAVLEKTQGPDLKAGQMPKADLVLLSHDQHADNLDVSGREYLRSAPLTLTTPEGAERLGGTSHGLETWESYEVDGVTITAVPAQHGPAPLVDVVGPVTGFIISSDDGPTIYISGDTVIHDGTDEIVRRYRGKIDYALLNAGAVNAAPRGEEPVYATMRAVDAVKLAGDLQAQRYSIMHADSWKHFTELMPQARATALASSSAHRFIDLSGHEQKSIPITN